MASLDEAKEIIKSSPISSIISFYHPITRKGGNYEGVCPFHGDTHPSLKVNDNLGIYKCFACGAAGDAIKFVQDKVNLNYIEAVKEIAGHLGITVEERQGAEFKNPKYEMALKVLKAANKLYQKVANDIKPPNFTSFCKSRNLVSHSIIDFEVGYAPPNNALLNYLHSLPKEDKDKALSVALELGLIRNSKNGKGQYDFYRDRVMFPIWDHSGKVRGFSSRAVLPEQKPKYLNSGESFIFDKGNTLYGFNLAKQHIRERKQAIIVEGNMDVISLHQFGFKNSVGTMGISLSQSSIRLLNNMTDHIVLGMDSDPAGIKAMTKINNDFMQMGVIPKYLSYQPSKDPDEFLNEFGRLELAKRIEEAPSFLDFLISQEIPESIPQSTDQKLAILNKIFSILAPLGNGLHANEKAITAAKTLGLASSNDDIISEYKKYIKHNAAPPMTTRSSKKVADKPIEPQGVQQELSTSPSPVINSSRLISKTDKLLLESLITHPEMVLSNKMSEILDLIDHFEVKRIVQWLKGIYLEIDEAEYSLFVQDKMQEAMPADIKEVIASSLFNHRKEKLESTIIDKMVSDLTLKLEMQKLKNQREALKEKQRNALSDEEGIVFLKEILNIEKELIALKNK